MKQYTATANDEGVRLSRFVQSVTRDFPTSLLYKSFRNKRIKVNGKKGAPEDRIQAGDLIELYINDEFFPPEGAKAARKPAPKKQQNQPKVTVIYEDENIAVLYKPTHLLCHSDRTGDANLVDAFTQYLAQKGEYDAHSENRFKPGICNRLDRGTEGLVIAAKSYAALRDMNEIIRTDLLKKEYYTITVGIPQSGRFTAWWEHDEKNNKVSIHAHQSQDERRKQIITDVDVLRTAGPFALCKIGLITGRTHQIRAHLAYLGKPVLGDIKYGNRKMNEQSAVPPDHPASHQLVCRRQKSQPCLHLPQRETEQGRLHGRPAGRGRNAHRLLREARIPQPGNHEAVRYGVTSHAEN